LDVGEVEAGQFFGAGDGSLARFDYCGDVGDGAAADGAGFLGDAGGAEDGEGFAAFGEEGFDVGGADV